MSRISIIIPAYNAGPWIAETLQSVVRQKFDGLELILVDDGSTDDTTQLVHDQFPEVTVIHQANLGPSAARTRGLNSANGAFVKYLDSDDLLEPGILERQWRLANSAGNPPTDVVYCNWQRLVSVDGSWRRGDLVERKLRSIHSDPELSVFLGFWAPTASYLWRTSFLRDKHPGWHPKLPVIQDARYPFDAIVAGARFVHDSEIGVLYRVHTNGSVSTNNAAAFAKDCFDNTRELWELWRADPYHRLYHERRAAVLQSLENIAFESSYDDGQFRSSVHCAILEIAPDWQPAISRKRAFLYRILGFNATRFLIAISSKRKIFLR